MLATVDSSVTLIQRERHANDWYCEPAWAVEGLLDVQRFSGWVWDPACGKGTIPQVCKAHGLNTIATDLVDRGYGIGGRDFLTWESLDGIRPQNIISNPPFNLAEPFLRKALTIVDHKVALLLRLSWCEGAKRRWIWDTTPLAAVHPFARRVSMPPGNVEVEAKGGAVAFAWFVWAKDHRGPAIVSRIERGPK